MTLAVHLFLIALDRLQQKGPGAPFMTQSHRGMSGNVKRQPSALLPCLGFAAVMALNVLTQGTHRSGLPYRLRAWLSRPYEQLRLLFKLHLIPSTAVFLLIAAPWHILAALRNPPIALPAGLGLPAKGGWAWFYLYNEHIARFLSKRIPHDYGQTPVWLFWLLLVIWIMPWGAFLPTAIAQNLRALQSSFSPKGPGAPSMMVSSSWVGVNKARAREAALALILWTIIVSASSPSPPPGILLPARHPRARPHGGGFLARADRSAETGLRRSALRWHLCLLVPLATLIAAVCSYFAVTAPHAAPGTDIATLIAANPEFYNVSLGHLFDLTGAAMGLFRGPLTDVAAGMLILGPASYLLRRQGHSLRRQPHTSAGGMIVVLLAAHEGLVRFNPILGSKDLAEAINNVQAANPQPDDLIVLDGELTSGLDAHLLHRPSRSIWSTAASTASGTAASGPTPPTSSRPNPPSASSGPAHTASFCSPPTQPPAPATSHPTASSTHSLPPEARRSSPIGEAGFRDKGVEKLAKVSDLLHPVPYTLNPALHHPSPLHQLIHPRLARESSGSIAQRPEQHPHRVPHRKQHHRRPRPPLPDHPLRHHPQPAASAPARFPPARPRPAPGCPSSSAANHVSSPKWNAERKPRPKVSLGPREARALHPAHLMFDPSPQSSSGAPYGRSHGRSAPPYGPSPRSSCPAENRPSSTPPSPRTRRSPPPHSRRAIIVGPSANCIGSIKFATQDAGAHPPPSSLPPPAATTSLPQPSCRDRDTSRSPPRVRERLHHAPQILRRHPHVAVRDHPQIVRRHLRHRRQRADLRIPRPRARRWSRSSL